MRIKNVFQWLYEYVQNYNLFIPENNYEDEDDDDEIEDITNEQEHAAMILNRQKYTTWLYIILLLISLYILFHTALIQSQSRTITISPVTQFIFEQLYPKYKQTLSCPCSKVAMPYRDFVSNRIRFHDVCSSQFVNDEWIKAMYLKDASQYGTTDFRTTASSQFYLLSRFCSLSKQTVWQNQLNFDKDELVTIKLLLQNQVESQTYTIFNSMKKSTSTQVISFLDYLRTTIQANSLVSALNTNIIVFIGIDNGNYVSFTRPTTYHTDDMYDDSAYEAEWCLRSNPIVEVSFFTNINYSHSSWHQTWFKPNPDAELVNGFYGTCTPLEALLSSTLDCLYDIQCLQLLSDRFPAIHQMYLNWSDYVLFSKQNNASVYEHLLDLFIEEWSIQINYSEYFRQCSPLSCTYTTSDIMNYSYAITLFISLYGGLIIILRLIALFIVHVLWRGCSTNTNNEHGTLLTFVRKLSRSLKQLNLYKQANNRNENSIRQQKMNTRIYLILLFGSFLVFLLFTSLNTEKVTKIEQKPSFFTYQRLQNSHSKALDCPCSNTTISYSKFISFSPTFHQICSSEFVSEYWLSFMENIYSSYVFIDWRSTAYSFFRLISHLCILAKKTSNDAIDRFMLESFVISNVLNENDFETQLNATLNQFYHSTIGYFGLLVEAVHLVVQTDQPYFKVELDYTGYVDQNLITIVETDESSEDQSAHIKFRLTGTRDVHSLLVNCICATNPHCKSFVAMYNNETNFNNGNNHSVIYILPGLITGCSAMNSLLRSTLECFYADSNCITMIIKNIVSFNLMYDQYDSWSKRYGLVDNPKMSQFPPNTSVQTIVKKLMIEKWNTSYSYIRFYESCAPSYCTYVEKVRTKTVTDVITTLLSMVGGLIVSLHIITPYIVKLISYLLRLIFKKQQHSQHDEQIQLQWYDRLKPIVWNLITLFYNIIIDLNIFHRRDFGSNIHRTITMRLGQWATRLYIVLFLISLIVITIYNFVQPRIITKTFPKPSFTLYEELREEYKDKLECSCASIATTYDQFVEIRPIFHEICTSAFASDEWRMNLTRYLDPTLAAYEQRDYRRFLSAHLQYLTGLCNLSMDLVTSSVDQFFRSLFITTQLLSEKDFYTPVHLAIQQSKSIAPTIFARVFFLIRSTNHGNAIVSTYGTNFEYILPWEEIYGTYAPTQAIIYDNNCSCGLQSNCTTQAIFMETNINHSITVQGLKMGCTPSESFHLSTLECFYNQSCIDLIREYVHYIDDNNSTNVSYALSGVTKHFSMNSTISELIENVFVDEWLIQVNYSLYFQECSPIECTYSYMSESNLLHIVVLVLGLQGGLTIILQWVCPKTIRIIAKIYEYRQRRTNIIRTLPHTSVISSSKY